MVDIKKLSHLYEGSILSWEDILKYRTDIPVLEQIKRGSEKPTVFMPFMGEFGFFINTYIRFIHYFKCPKKIVCCRPGEEIFFPSADEFMYDWNDFQQDKDRIGANIPAGNKQYRFLKTTLQQQYPNHEIVEVGHEISYRFVQFMPVPLEPFCDKIEVDVVIGPRNRPRDEQRNFPRDKWQNIVRQLKGWRIGIVGQEETSYDFEESVNKSWQYPQPADAMISMLKNCKVFIGTDTGTAHVAAMCGCPMVLFRKKDWSTDFIPFMKQQNDKLVFVENGWETSDQVISQAHRILQLGDSAVKLSPPKKAKVCLHIPLHVKDHNHAKMVLEKKKLFKDLRALDVDTLFTIDRDDIGIDLSDVPHIRLHHPTGIVKPTQEAILYFQSRHGSDCFMMRTGQDVKVDIQGLASHLDYLRAQGTDLAFLSGDFDRHNDIFGVLKEIGINEKPRMFQFIQGNFMSAPMKMWEKYYMHLPSSVTHYKDDSVMSFCLERDGGKLEKVKKFWSHDPKGHFDQFILQGKTIEQMYQEAKKSPSDVKDLLPIYEKYANQSESVIEFRRGQNPSTLCFVASNAKKINAYNEQGFSLAQEVKVAVGSKFSHFIDNSLNVDIAHVDLLHLDTKHNYDRVMAELTKHHSKVGKFILIYDYETFGVKGDDGKSPGIKQAVSDFIKQCPEWKIAETHKPSNGLVVLTRESSLVVAKEDSKPDALFLYRLFLPKLDEEKMLFLRSFVDRLSEFKEKVTQNTKTVMIIDNSPEDMVEMIKGEFGNVFEIVSVASKAQKEKLSSGKPCSPQRYTLYISSMKYAEKYGGPETTVFFCEDDYLYRPDSFEKAYNFLKKHPNDFVTMYDHPDRYRDSSREREPKMAGFNLELLWDCGHHWRTSISTCHSFVSTMKSLEDNDTFTLKANLERRDHDMWSEVWRRGKSKLYGAIPGLASHRRGPHLDDWDWDSIIKEASK